MQVANQNQNGYYVSQGYTSGTIQDKENAYYTGGGAVADPTTRAQKTRVTTDTTGAFTWTYPTPFPVGIVPVVQLTVEDPTAGNHWDHKIVQTTNTQVSVQISKTTAVTVVGISVLGIAANPQGIVHINAVYPTV